MKNLKIIGMLLGGLMVLGSLSACGDSDNDEPTPQPTKEPASLKVDYKCNVSQQLLDVATVFVRYIGDNGQVASEQMTTTTWTKSVTMTLPAKAGLNIQPTLKGNVAEAEYSLSAMGQMTYNWIDKDGKLTKEGLTESTPTLEAVFYAEGIGQYLGAITANCQQARAFNKDYDVTNTTITWGGNAGDDSTQGTGISDEGATGDNR